MGQTKSWMSGWRGSALAALIAIVCAIPGLIALPIVDRNEAVFAQATAQMLDEHDPTDIRFQDNLRRGTMPAAHWLQALGVMAVSKPEVRAIWAYRLPSLLGLALAAAAAVFGGARLFGPRAGFLAGAFTGASFLGVTLGDLATADALFVGTGAVMLAAFAHLYADHSEGARLRKRHLWLFWLGLIAAFMVKGLLIFAFAGLAGIALIAMDRRVRWLGGLGWGWGLLALAALAGPWLVAITVATDGQFWQGTAPNLIHGVGLGFQSLIAPALLFPACFILPFAVAYAWKARATPGVRLAIAWLVPGWLFLEAVPGVQLHGAAALYISLFWLGAAGLTEVAGGLFARIVAMALSLAIGGLIAFASLWLVWRFGDDWTQAGLAAFLAVAAALTGAVAAWRPGSSRPLIVSCVLGVATAWVLLVFVLPGMPRLWPTRSLLQGLAVAGLDPRDGLARGPVAAAGYAEPSLVFQLGAETELGDADTATAALADNRPAIVSKDLQGQVTALLAQQGLAAASAFDFEGYDPAEGKLVSLFIMKRSP